jgi:hypothetical protein
VRADFPVILDACVLIPMPLADSLLRLAVGPRLYLPKWTDQIMAEVSRNLQENFGVTEQAAYRLCSPSYGPAPAQFWHPQATSSPTEAVQASSSPVAYVYVSNFVSSTGNYQVSGYAAAANGALTPIPGSPFPDSVQYLALNGAWLFGTEVSATGGDQNVDSYSIASNGALTLAQRTHVNDSGGGPVTLLLDHTGSSLYVDYYTTNNDCLLAGSH